MDSKRKIEIFSAGCPVCTETVKLVEGIACPSCEVSVLDMNDPAVIERAKDLGVGTVPAVAVNGKLLNCDCGCRLDEETLRAAGIGKEIAN